MWDELGVPGAPSLSTVWRTLARSVEQDWRSKIAAAAYAHATVSGLLIVVLYDVTTLYFEAEREDKLRKVGMSKERRVDPQILVNLLLKSYSGRPRPHQTDLFGGDLPFMPAGSFSGQCENNCSFISGEAAGAGWLICLIPLLPPRLRLALAPGIIAVSLLPVFIGWLQHRRT